MEIRQVNQVVQRSVIVKCRATCLISEMLFQLYQILRPEALWVVLTKSMDTGFKFWLLHL